MIVSSVDRGSSADKGGVKIGDFVIALNGNDNQASSLESVLTVLKCLYGAVIALRVARPTPLPETNFEKRRAIIILQTKVSVRTK